MKHTVSQIVSKLTLEEKASLCSGLDFWRLKGVPRLEIPSVMVSDGPHGLRKQDDAADHLGIHDSIEAVCFPAACATAASFDEDLLEQLGSALGEECRAEKVSVLLGPALNIKRSPLCGRNFEYFSEDPYLAGKLAAAQVRGVQKWDVGACPKHFAANNQEYRRMTCSSEMDERTLREIYLPAFETVVKEAKPWAMMCAYNRVNGVFASENRKLLTRILREEWGFDGFVVSDWGAVNDRVAALAAGLELEMPGSGGVNDAKLVAAVQNGTLDEAVLDQAVERLLKIVFRYADAWHPEARFDREEHHALAVRLAERCGVLLQNTGVLPLSGTGTAAYIGPFAKKPRYQGGGSSHIHAHRVSGAWELAPAGSTYTPGFDLNSEETDAALLAQAVEQARAADTAVIFAGLPDRYESEGYDRAHMRLPENQNELIRQVAAVQPNTVVVLHVGSPVECPWADQVAAVLCMYLGGEGVGEATHSLLYGKVDPAGRLPETWALRLEDTPSYLSFPGDGKTVRYQEGVYVGYRYYTSKHMPVRWPFGRGLSYTQFQYGEVLLSAETLTEGGILRITVPVTNIGSRPGTETVQLYLADATGTFGRPARELKGFAKLHLQPGETGVAFFTLDARFLSYYSEELGDWYAASGEYRVLVGASCLDIRTEAAFHFQTDKQLPLVVDENTTFGELMAHPATAPAMAELLGRMKGTLGSGGDAISAEMARQMVKNAPLRSVKSFAHLPDTALQNMIAQFNQLLGNVEYQEQRKKRI